VPLQRLLRKHPATIHLHFEHAAGRLDELDLRLRKGPADLGRQTGSPWLVVSDYAKLDGDAHTEGYQRLTRRATRLTLRADLA
jgi:hypothetical protein